MISIVIPILKEGEISRENSAILVSSGKIAKKNCEIIFLDGGSSDRIIEIASRLGRVLKSKRGRALLFCVHSGLSMP